MKAILHLTTFSDSSDLFSFNSPVAICDFQRREDELMTELMNQRLNFIVK
jgi:hypothetical protein